MSTSAHTAMNRRTFTAAAGVALATGAALASTARASEPAAAAYQTPRDPMAELWAGGYASEYADRVAAVEEADIVVVGAGVSGISAALEAAQQGVSVILLESQAIAGGNGNYTDCVFTFGSPQQLEAAEAAGMTVTADQIIRSEIELYDYMVDGELWADVLEHSADNTQWLLDAGCLTGETAVFYGGELGKTPTALMWRDGIGTGGACAMTPMLKTLKGLGVEPTLNTRARALKVADDGSVCGVYAEGPDGVVEYDAKAVILAGGGWGANPELCSKLGGYDMSKSSIFSAPAARETPSRWPPPSAAARTPWPAATCSATACPASPPATSCSTTPPCGSTRTAAALPTKTAARPATTTPAPPCARKRTSSSSWTTP